MVSRLYTRLAIISAASLLAACAQNTTKHMPLVETGFRPVYQSFFTGKKTYETFYERAGTIEPLSETIIGAIVPHHLLVGTAFARFYSSLRNQHPSTVVIIGPNHFNKGKGNILTADGEYDTPYGSVQIDTSLQHSLLQSPLLALDREPFIREHSISAEVAFIKKTWPDATIIPIILKSSVTQNQSEELGKLLVETVPHDALVLASVDFSHYLPEIVADFHDETSEAAIRSFDLPRVMTLEIDSPASIVTLLTYLTARGAQNVVYREHTNSASYTNHPEIAATTSHFFFGFSTGKPEYSPAQSVFFMGDAIFGRDIEKLFTNKRTKILDALAGEEDRFFRGSDISVLNLEGPITEEKPTTKTPIMFAFDRHIALPLLKRFGVTAVHRANNHLTDAGTRGADDTTAALSTLHIASIGYPEACIDTTIDDRTVAICGFDDTNERMDEATAIAITKDKRRTVDRLIVSLHWGVEGRTQPTDRQRRIAHAFIDAGADAIIGHHPHVVEPLEVYKNAPILYSLGNVLFDQPDPSLSSGLALGLIFKESTTLVYLYPMHTTHGEPRLFDAAERSAFFAKYLEKLGDYADESLEGKIVLH